MVSLARSKNMKRRMAYVRSFIKKRTGRRKKKGGKINVPGLIGEAAVVGPWAAINPTSRIARRVLGRKRKGGKFRFNKIIGAPIRLVKKTINKIIPNNSKPKPTKYHGPYMGVLPSERLQTIADEINKGPNISGGAFGLAQPKDYNELMRAYGRYPMDNVGLSGGAIRGFGYKDVINTVRKIMGTKKGSGIRAAGIRAAGCRKHRKRCGKKKGRGLRRPTKRDLYVGAGNSTGVFYSKVKSEKRKLKTIPSNPETDLMMGYRELYRNSGITRENPVYFDYKRSIPPNVTPMKPHKMKLHKIEAAGGDKRGKKGGRFLRGGRFISGGSFVKKIMEGAARAAARSARGAARVGKKIIGKGLTEEAGLNGKGHPDYIYH